MSVSPPSRFALGSLRRQAGLAARILQVRLRFFFVLLVAFAVVGKRDLLRNYWDKLTRGDSVARESVSSETEYWCPMCPGVVSDWPSKCPVCNMALVQRQRGEAVPLPSGVLARMQLSPYRMQLAGIQTTPVAYQPLVHEVKTAGLVGEAADVAHVLVEAEVFDKDLPFLSEGQAVEASSEAFPGHAAFSGKVSRLTASTKGGRAPSASSWKSLTRARSCA